jgi:iron complex transport system ATP-binding protein
MNRVSCYQDDKYLLRDINWTVKSGEHWAIIGLNGSGKTTLLRLIAGYVFPSSGKVRVLGRSFGEYDWRELRKSIGFISSFLQDKLYPGESALEIVLSGVSASIGLYERPQKKYIDKAKMLLRDLECEKIANQSYISLSQGEKQKVLIARALIHSPQLLIMDEPCAGLDIFSREKLLSSIEKISRKKKAPAILYVSHHIEEILPVFTHSLLLRRGAVHSAGETKQVITKSNLISFFETDLEVSWRKNRPFIKL